MDDGGRMYLKEGREGRDGVSLLDHNATEILKALIIKHGMPLNIDHNNRADAVYNLAEAMIKAKRKRENSKS